ncbi:hypothetical protein BK634_01125 [Pseudomonas chlororaphis]|jgi:hypothetical protein|uniref:Uncharacterized protein n=1 Tax=Pseudomonas morbosilactucae TaxID=2938197 RepID=A0A9X1YV44_9PSED|nr:hypothetical protein [Pseudomonas morbosilactucae]MCK9798556.1 hypothetical protein [Pseudomonas morbosilactucae]MCK9816059.1 hypothetical protein [Pseudomonas morbosilactucae]ROL73349.1 hypothetical protein BK634_01125 [Pseudomonas chlororaphis]WEK09643.1 MAG: hypothetical protein P0Y51_01165 [Pseudomonas sp.]
MEDGYLKVAMRQGGASVNKYSMQNRLRLIQLVHAQHFVEVPTGASKIDFTQDWNGKIGEKAKFS